MENHNLVNRYMYEMSNSKNIWIFPYGQRRLKMYMMSNLQINNGFRGWLGPLHAVQGPICTKGVLYEGQTPVSRCLQTWWPGKWWLQSFHTYEMHACSSNTKLRKNQITHHIIRRNGISVLSSSKRRQETSALKTAQKLVNYVNACRWHLLCVYFQLFFSCGIYFLPPSFFFSKAYKAQDGLHPPSFRIIGMYYQAQLGKFLKGLVFSKHIVKFL